MGTTLATRFSRLRNPRARPERRSAAMRAAGRHRCVDCRMMNGKREKFSQQTTKSFAEVCSGRLHSNPPAGWFPRQCGVHLPGRCKLVPGKKIVTTLTTWFFSIATFFLAPAITSLLHHVSHTAHEARISSGPTHPCSLAP